MKIKNLLLLALTVFSRVTLQTQDSIGLIVGTYTNGTSKGIYSFNFNQSTRQASPLDTFELENPPFLTLVSGGTMIHTVSEDHDESTAVNVITFDKTTGHMQLQGSFPTKGEDPCYVETNGNLLLAANYSGSSMSVYPLNVNGSFSVMSRQFKGSIGGPSSECQQTSHVHYARFLPDGNGVIATDFSAGQLLRFELEGMRSLDNTNVTAKLSKDSGPRHIVFSIDSRFVYVMSELSEAVTAYQYNFGSMKKVQEIQSDEVGAQDGTGIHVSPDGRFLYTNNQLKNDGITIFKVNQKAGLLTKVDYQRTGIHPRHFNVIPNGRFLLCICRNDNTIQVFHISSANNLLTDVHQNISVGKTVCVQFYLIVVQPDIQGDGVFRVIEVTKQVCRFICLKPSSPF